MCIRDRFNDEINGLVFASDVLFMGYTDQGTNSGHIAVSALKPSATNDAQGLAFTATGANLTGANIGSALWAVVDGEPYDKLLKLSTSTGALLTSNFPSSQSQTGWVDLATNGAKGVTYLDGYLYVLASEANGCCDYVSRLYKINASNGSQTGMYNLDSGPNSIRGHNSPSGISNDGTNLIIFDSNEDLFWEVDPATGASNSRRHFCCDNMGSEAVAMRAGTNEVVLGTGSTLKHMSFQGNEPQLIKEHNANGSSVSNKLGAIKGMVIDDGSYISGTAVEDEEAGNDLLYVAHDSGKVSRTGLPSNKTNTPNALTTDGHFMYIVVETIGDSPDHIIVTTATSSVIENLSLIHI